MGFRTLEISAAAEIYIREGQLTVETMDLSILTQHKVSIITLDNKYLPNTLMLCSQVLQENLAHLAMHHLIICLP